MTTLPRILKQAAGIFIILMLLPGTAYLQEQTVPPNQQQEKKSAEPAQQQPSKLITPEDTTSTEPETPSSEQGAVANEKKEIAAPQEPAAVTAREEAPSSYTVIKGDTLWDIAATLFKDPFLWPFIWKANPSISNPDLIYPGNRLAIPSLAPIERALQATAEPKEKLVEKKIEEEQPPRPEPRSRESIAASEVIKPKPAQPAVAETPAEQGRLILPEEQAIPIIDKYAMLSAGFVSSEERDGRIVGAPEDSKTIFSYGDMVYVEIPSARNANIGDKFLIYTPEKRVGRYGRLIRGLGILQITAKDSSDVLTARITLSFDNIQKNNLLTPYQEPALVFNSSQKKAKDISGYIIEVTNNRAISGQLDFVYLNRGSNDGVDPGDRFIVYNEPEDNSFPKKKIGEVQVFIVKDQSSTAVVRKSTEPIARGDQVEFKK